MASASTIPITHVQGSSLTRNVDPDQAHFPPLPLEPEREQWEFLDRPDRAQVSFCPETVTAEDPKPESNPNILHHARSSPNLREYCLASDDDESDESSTVLVDDTVSDADSSAVLVSGPPSVWSAGDAKISFRDAIMRNKSSETKDEHAHQATHRKRVKKVKPTFVVKQIQRCNKSTGDLQSLAFLAFLEEEVMGDTDAQEYYGRKSAGAQGRRNGLKTRPDEAKRLQMTMAKKADQRERQQR
jgi:hypothetical protein